MTLTPDLKHIIQIVEHAGKNILLPHFYQQNIATTKEDGSIVTQADLACQAYLQKKLHLLAPNISFLGEEMSECEQIACLQSKESFWCVDPLDGTSNFATPMPMFAISIALIVEGKPILACIHDPVRQETFTAIHQQGAKLNGQDIIVSSKKALNDSVGFLDFKRLSPSLATHFATQKIYRSQRNLGSCALEWAWLAAGRAQFIIHGAEKLWDYAAGSLLVEESGCIVSDFSGLHPFGKKSMSSSILAAPQAIHQALTPHLHT
ncbi:MAG: inositol monophosphatase family protein [Mariprofundaceae bacterium]|nr:inositol monophosphatase family protein [Mariprofundaceae bacterium]